MSRLIQFTTLNDAFHYFFQAKGTPDTAEGVVVKQRHLRTAMILGWVAIDDAVAAFARNENLVWPKNCNRSLRLKLRHIWEEIKGTPLDEAEFRRYRDIRNAVAHPDGVAEILLTIEHVEEALTYCKATIKVMHPRLVDGELAKG